MTLKELIQRAIDTATQGLPLEARKAAEVAVEAMLPLAFSNVGDRLARGTHTRALLRRTKDLAVVDGSAEVPTDVLTACIDDAVLYDPADLTKRYSLTSWETLVRDSLDTRLGHFAMEGEQTLRVVEPDEAFDALTGPTIDLKLSIACSPEIPALNSAIDVPAEVIDELLAELVHMLRPVVVK